MDQPPPRILAPDRIIKDALLFGPVFLFWTWVMVPHVPFQERLWVLAGAAYTAVCLTGLSWLAFHMGRAVWRHQRETGAPE